MLSWEIWTDVASQMQSRNATYHSVYVRDLASTNDQIDFTRFRTCVRAFDGNLFGGRFCKLTAWKHFLIGAMLSSFPDVERIGQPPV